VGQFNIAQILESNAQEISVALILLGIVFLANGRRLIAPALGLVLGALAGVTINALLLQFADKIPLEENQMLGVSIGVGLVIFLVIRRLVKRIHMLIGGVLGAAITSVLLPIAAPLAGIELTFLVKAIVVDFGFLIGTRMLKGEGDTIAMMLSSTMGALFVVQGGQVLLGNISSPVSLSLEVGPAFAIFVLLAGGTAGQMRMKWRNEDTEDEDDYEDWEDEQDEEYDSPDPIHDSLGRGMPQRGPDPTRGGMGQGMQGMGRPQQAQPQGRPQGQGGYGGGRPSPQMATQQHQRQDYGNDGPPVRRRQQDSGVAVRRRAGARQFSFED
jgi:hypothetical protein